MWIFQTLSEKFRQTFSSMFVRHHNAVLFITP